MSETRQPWAGKFHALPEALLGDLNQALGLVAHLPAWVGGGAVTMEAADKGAHIYADDVAPPSAFGAQGCRG